MSESEVLSSKIRAFLEKFGSIRPDYDPEFDDPEDRWTGPDSSLLECAADTLDAGGVPDNMIISWESGCFSPYTSKEGQEFLSSILEELSGFRRNVSPRP